MTTVPRVFITQNPMRRNVRQELVFMYDLTPAREFGSLEVLLPSTPTPLETWHMVKALTDKLAGFTPDDHLLCLGSPVAIAAAAAIVAERNAGVIPLLVWDRQVRQYVPVRIDTRGGYSRK